MPAGARAAGRAYSALVPTLKAIYTAPTEQAAEEALQEFAELGQRHPAIVRTWQAAWNEFTPYRWHALSAWDVLSAGTMSGLVRGRPRRRGTRRRSMTSEKAVRCRPVRR